MGGDAKQPCRSPKTTTCEAGGPYLSLGNERIVRKPDRGRRNDQPEYRFWQGCLQPGPGRGTIRHPRQFRGKYAEEWYCRHLQREPKLTPYQFCQLQITTSRF